MDSNVMFRLSKSRRAGTSPRRHRSKKKKQRQPAKQTKRVKVSAQKLCAGTVLSRSAPGGGRASGYCSGCACSDAPFVAARGGLYRKLGTVWAGVSGLSEPLDPGLRRDDSVRNGKFRYRDPGAGRDPCSLWHYVYLKRELNDHSSPPMPATT